MKIDKKQKALVEKAKRDCLSCKGSGCKECSQKVEKILICSNIGIPLVFWDLTLNSFPGDPRLKEFLSQTAKEIDKVYDEGKNIAFVGRHGIGKTFAATFLLKVAQAKGYSCYYTSMVEIVDVIISHSEEKKDIKEKLQQTDFLVIDEFDNRYIPNSVNANDTFGSNMEWLLRNRFQHMMPTIFCSNNQSIDQVFAGPFQESFGSLFSYYVNEIPVAGLDLRKGK